MALAQQIQAWNTEAKEALIKSYKEKGFKASGKWANELQPEQTIGIDRINVKMLGADYTEFMINGRGPTSPTGPYKSGPSLLSIITKWVKVKGLTINPETLTASIHAFGTKQYYDPDPKKKRLLTDVFTDQRTEQLIDIIRQNTIFELRESLTKILS